MLDSPSRAVLSDEELSPVVEHTFHAVAIMAILTALVPPLAFTASNTPAAIV